MALLKNLSSLATSLQFHHVCRCQWPATEDLFHPATDELVPGRMREDVEAALGDGFEYDLGNLRGGSVDLVRQPRKLVLIRRG